MGQNLSLPSTLFVVESTVREKEKGSLRPSVQKELVKVNP